jgi:hypothetical protein
VTSKSFQRVSCRSDSRSEPNAKPRDDLGPFAGHPVVLVKISSILLITLVSSGYHQTVTGCTQIQNIGEKESSEGDVVISRVRQDVRSHHVIDK